MMNTNDNKAQFYFANLGADIMRCIVAAKNDDNERYDDSLLRAQQTLFLLQNSGQSSAYEEGLLLLRGLEYAKNDNKLDVFSSNLNKIMFSVIRAGVSLKPSA